MTTAIDSTAPAPAPATKNAFQRIAGALFAPVETFTDIARKPDILIPMLFLVIIGYGTTLLTMRYLDFDAAFAQQAEVMKKQNPNLSDADLERFGRISKSMTKVTFYVLPVVMVAAYAVMALILFGAFRLMGGEGTYKQSLSVFLYSWMPMVLLSIVAAIVLLARGDLVDPQTMATVVKSNPAFLVDFQEQPVLFSFLSSVDIFSVWMILLLVFGFSAVSGFSRAKTAAIIVSLWVIMIVVKVGFAAMGAARMNA